MSPLMKQPGESSPIKLHETPHEATVPTKLCEIQSARSMRHLMRQQRKEDELD